MDSETNKAVAEKQQRVYDRVAECTLVTTNTSDEGMNMNTHFQKNV